MFSTDLAVVSAKRGLATFIAAGSNGEIYRTTDGGATWASATLGFTKSSSLTWRSLAYWGGVFVAVGYDGSTQRISRSTDVGENWSAFVSHSITGNLVAVGAYDGTFIAGDDTGNIYRSTDDGASWGSPIATGLSIISEGETIAHNKTNWVVAGTASGSGKMAYSTNDGVTWASSSGSADAQAGSAHADSGGNMFVGSNLGKIVKSTNSGNSFSSLGDKFSGTINIVGIVGSQQFLLAVGNGGKYVRSTDGGSTFGSETSLSLSSPGAAATDGRNVVIGSIADDDFAISSNKGQSFSIVTDAFASGQSVSTICSANHLPL